MKDQDQIRECKQMLASYRLILSGARHQRSAILQDISHANNRLEQLDKDVKMAPENIKRLELLLSKLEDMRRSFGSGSIRTKTEKDLARLKAIAAKLPRELVLELLGEDDSTEEASA